MDSAVLDGEQQEDETISVVAIHTEMLLTLTVEEWNDAISSARDEDPDFVIDLRGAYLSYQDFRDRNLRNADFTGATLRETVFRRCNLTGSVFDNAEVARADFSYSILTDSNLRVAPFVETAHTHGTVGYVPPPPDITEEVARHYLNEAINDPNSIVNDGLAEIVESGVRAWWHGNQLKFYLVSEIDELVDLCDRHQCSCETDHMCEGTCDCCPCARGNCECEPHHTHEEIEESGDRYLATFVGHIEFGWSASTGLYPKIVADELSRHPHVSSSGNICWGDTYLPKESLRMADWLMSVQGWICQHNPSDEYRHIRDLPKL